MERGKMNLEELCQRISGGCGVEERAGGRNDSDSVIGGGEFLTGFLLGLLLIMLLIRQLLPLLQQRGAPPTAQEAPEGEEEEEAEEEEEEREQSDLVQISC